MADTRARIVLTTADTKELADRIAGGLVERRVAACVSVVAGVTSTYRWKGELCVDAEFLLVIKTTEDRFDSMCTALRELHSYEQPEILALPVCAGDREYLAWLDEAIGDSD